MSSTAERPMLSNTALSEETKKKYTFVVGIDFGTTYSGVAYSRVGDVDGQNNHPVITEITKWPMQSNIQMTNQAPTVSVYNERGVLQKWGHRSIAKGKPPTPGTTTISMFKLHLDETQSVNIPPLPNGVTVLQAISDYLKAIYEYSFNMMNKNLGSVSKASLRFCLTVPAVWTEDAKITMRQAAIQAGIVSETDPQDRLLLVGEPEAAALYCETFLEQYNLQPDDTFLICDAGGGTVDLVLYRVSVEEDGTRSLIEEVAGDGGMCGSITLDLRFKEFIVDVFAQLGDAVKPLSDEDLDGIVRNFAESLKFISYDETDPEFDEEFISVDLPRQYYGSGDHRLSDRVQLIDDKIQVSPYEIRDKVFTPVIDQVLDLVESQVSKVAHLNAIFLVGGFGSSPMLYSKLKAKFQSEVPLVCTPGRAEMAIVRGAVLMGINPRYVKRRVVRRTYGYECALPFERGLDPEHLKSLTPQGQAYCNKRFQKYAIKGQIKDIDYYAETKFHGYYNGQPKLSLCAYDGDINKIPRHTTDKSVKKIVDFKIEVPELPDKEPDSMITFNVRFYLYQTEIKVQVEIEGHVKIYTGSYREKTIPFLGSVHSSASDLNIAGLSIGDTNETTFGSQSIERSYQEEVQPVAEPNDEELGIQGDIPE